MSFEETANAWEIVGALTDLSGSAPFFRAKVVIQNGEELAVVEGYTGQHVKMSETSSDGVFMFDPIPLEKYAEVWLFRNNFPFLDDAVQEVLDSKILIDGPTHSEGVTWMVVRMDSGAEQLLNEWCDHSAALAVEAGVRGYGSELQSMRERAMNCASLSFSLCNAPTKTGLYLAILEVVGRTEWHNSTVEMLQTTRGFHFLQSAINHKNVVLTRVYKQRSERLEAEAEDLRRLLKLS